MVVVHIMLNERANAVSLFNSLSSKERKKKENETENCVEQPKRGKGYFSSHFLTFQLIESILSPKLLNYRIFRCNAFLSTSYKQLALICGNDSY